MTNRITTSQKLQRKIEEAILSRQYLPGDRLPSERDIMKRDRVGRSTVREAYRSLRQKGLVDIRPGDGAFVREVDSANVGDTLSALIRHRGISVRHLQEFREAVESRCAAYAAERATTAQKDHLKVLIDQMEARYRSHGPGDLHFYEMELNLHTQLARISGNPMFEWFTATFQKNADSFSKILAHQTEKSEEALEDWRHFIDALYQKEVTRASMIISSHIIRFGNILENAEAFKPDHQPKDKP
jgi:DNA-binding FadR family transcriptional regulator